MNKLKKAVKASLRFLWCVGQLVSAYMFFYLCFTGNTTIALIYGALWLAFMNTNELADLKEKLKDKNGEPKKGH